MKKDLFHTQITDRDLAIIELRKTCSIRQCALILGVSYEYVRLHHLGTVHKLRQSEILKKFSTGDLEEELFRRGYRVLKDDFKSLTNLPPRRSFRSTTLNKQIPRLKKNMAANSKGTKK